MTQKSITSEILQQDEPYFHSIATGTTTDGTTNVVLANTDGKPYILSVPESTVYHVKGTGLVVETSGMVAYFKFEAILKNILGGTDKNLNFIKLVTGGAAFHTDSWSHVITTDSGVYNAELLEIGQTSKNGTGSVTCDLGFDFVSAKVKISAASNNLNITANGDAGKTLKWKVSLAVNAITL